MNRPFGSILVSKEYCLGMLSTAPENYRKKLVKHNFGMKSKIGCFFWTTLYFESKKCLKESGFELRKWNSNNKELMDKICVDENENNYDLGQICSGLRKVLGINWDIEKDLFAFDFDEIVQLVKPLKFPKIILLDINAKLFDMLGLISSITLQGKLLFKLLRIDKSDWDDELNDIIKQKF